MSNTPTTTDTLYFLSPHSPNLYWKIFIFSYFFLEKKSVFSHLMPIIHFYFFVTTLQSYLAYYGPHVYYFVFGSPGRLQCLCSWPLFQYCDSDSLLLTSYNSLLKCLWIKVATLLCLLNAQPEQSSYICIPGVQQSASVPYIAEIYY